MKKIIIAVVSVLFMFSVNQVSAEPIKLKLSTVVPPKGHSVAKILKPWAEMVNKESQGTLDVEIYGGGVLGRNVKLYFKQIDTGVIDMALIYPTYFGERFPDIDFVHIPFMAETYLEGALGVQRMFNKGLISGFDDFEVLMILGTSPFYLNTIFPVKTPEDLKGHKCRSVSKFHADLLSSLGMTPVPLSVSKSAESLSRKLIEATIESPASLKIFGGYKIAKNHIIVPFGSFVLAVAMNKQKYENLPPKAKAALDKYRGEWLSRFWAEESTPLEKGYLDEWKKDPEHTVVIPTGEDLKKWKAAIQPSIEAWKKEKPGRGKMLEAYQKELDRIRAGN